jgi:hypothetical protein
MLLVTFGAALAFQSAGANLIQRVIS